MSRRLVLVSVLSVATVLAPTAARPAHAVGPLIVEAVFTGGNNSYCPQGGPVPCHVSASSSFCQMAWVNLPNAFVEGCSVTVTGTAQILAYVGFNCTGIGSGTVTLRRTNGLIVDQVDVTFVIANSTLAWAGADASVTPTRVAFTEGAFHPLCGTPIGTMAGSFTTTPNI